MRWRRRRITYTHAFVESDALAREPAADAIEAARITSDVRQLYATLGVLGAFEGADPASTSRADARIRTADPFITSEVLYQLSYVGVPRRLAGSAAQIGRA